MIKGKEKKSQQKGILKMRTDNQEQQPPQDLASALSRIEELSRELAATKKELMQVKAGPYAKDVADLEEFKLILDNMPIMITIYDLYTLKFRINKEFECVLGWTQEDIDTNNLIELLFSDPGERASAVEYIRDLKPGFRDFKTRAKSGKVVDTSWANIKLPDGRQLGIGIDVRERKKTEEEIVRTQLILNQAEQMVHLGAWWIDYTNYTDLDDNPLRWSAEVYRIFGYEPGAIQVTNELFFRHVHPDDRVMVRAAVAEAFAGRHAYSIEHRIIRTDGKERTVLEHGNIEFDIQDRPLRLIGAVQDITQQKQFEEKLKTINKELEQFAYVASHDLQEPLRMVASFTELLERRYASLFDERGKRYMQRIIEGASYMHALIQDLLTFSRIGRMDTERTTVDCNKLVDNVIADFIETMPETGANVHHTELPVIRANEMNMIQVFQNLISNALKFHKPDEPPHVEISAEKRGSDWLFKVKDNGIGIDPRFFDKIFAIFQRLHSRDKYPGTGIGLAICKKIIDNYGGKIWVESAEGEGSTFYFTIPG